MRLHRVNLGISPRPPAPPIDVAVGFVLVDRRDGRPPAILETWDDAMGYIERLRRPAAGRVVFLATYVAGPKLGQFYRTSRWRVELELWPWREIYVKTADPPAETPKRPWQPKIEGGGP